MKLKKFRIRNYKSIIDSGECILGPDFTTFIGKNESGKTAILEALRDFDREQSISTKAHPLNSLYDKPSCELTFEASPDEIEAIISESQIKNQDDSLQQLLNEEICLIKFASGEYRLKNRLDPTFNDPHEGPQSEADRLRIKKQRLAEILEGQPIPDLQFEGDPVALNDSIQSLRSLVKARLGFIPEEAKRVELVELLHELTRIMNSFTVSVTAPSSTDKLAAAIVKRLPRFLLFSDFNDVLPFQIPVESLKENHAVEDFAKIANLDLEALMKTQDLQKRINILSRSSAIISGEFMGFWEQNKIELIARSEGNNLLFFIKESEGTDLFKGEQRSKGFQWFLSFYLRMTRYKNENVVILIDEPGMNLHPVAQKDILKIMSGTSLKAQIIFTTHSPILINPNRLDRVRIVVKDKRNGSIIKDSIHSGIDYETLMPVISALGGRFPANVSSTPETMEDEDIMINEDKKSEEVIEETPPVQASVDSQKITPPQVKEDDNEELDEIESEKSDELEGEEALAEKPRKLFGLFGGRKNVAAKDKAQRE